MKAWFALFLAVPFATGCASVDRRFPLRDPVTVDGDLRPVSLPRPPTVYVSPLIWDGADNLAFRPFSEVWAFRAPTESTNVNSVDEVPDSAWFTNRVGARPVGIDELTRGACDPDAMVDPDAWADGSWIVDHGKTDGSSLGFRVNLRGKKYLVKIDTGSPERPSAASVIGAAAYHAVGFNTSCEQVVYVRPAVFHLLPGLTYKSNFAEERPFDQAALDHVLSFAPRRGDRVRLQLSAWLPGKLIGPFRYAGTRADDPNDVVPHEDRRELRGGRLLAAWLDHFDAREQNSMDSWQSAAGDGSGGRVLHYYLDTSDCLGSAWDWDPITRRLGHSYVVDWADMGRDFATLGIPQRPWDTAKVVRGQEMFNYFDVASFDAEGWKNEYPNPAFDRMTEHDAAWMARILAKLSPADVGALASMGKLSDGAHATYLASVLEGRLEKILDRYLTRLSPLADALVEGGDRFCAVDLAEKRGVRAADRFHYAAHVLGGESLHVDRRARGEVCVSLPRVAADRGLSDDAPERYLRVVVTDGVARGPLVAHFYDEGPSRGHRLVGLERPERSDE